MPAGHLHRRLLGAGSDLSFAQYLQSLSSYGVIVGMGVASGVYNDEIWWGADSHDTTQDDNSSASYRNALITTKGTQQNGAAGVDASAGVTGNQIVSGDYDLSATGLGALSIGEGRTAGIFLRFGTDGMYFNLGIGANSFVFQRANGNSATGATVDMPGSVPYAYSPTSMSVGGNHETGNLLVLTTEYISATSPKYRHKLYNGGALRVTHDSDDTGIDGSGLIFYMENDSWEFGGAGGGAAPSNDCCWQEAFILWDHLMTLEEYQTMYNNYLLAP